jgi:hypothetical protein
LILRLRCLDALRRVIWQCRSACVLDFQRRAAAVAYWTGQTVTIEWYCPVTRQWRNFQNVLPGPLFHYFARRAD